MWYIFHNVVIHVVLIWLVYIKYKSKKTSFSTIDHHTFPTCDLRRLKLFTTENLDFHLDFRLRSPKRDSKFTGNLEKSQDLKGPVGKNPHEKKAYDNLVAE